VPVLLCVAASSSTSRLLSVNMRTHTPPEYLLTFSLRNACVVPYDDRASRFRTSIVSLDAEIEAIVHGFSEYVNGYQRLTGVRPPAEDDAAMLKQCDRRPLGIGVPFSCNNIYHQAFHAVPAFERWAATVSAAPIGDLDFVPLIYPTAAVGKKMSVEPSKWHAWEFSIRPFTRLPSAAIANRTHQIVNTACTCYDTLHGNAEAFNPIALRSAARLRAFRQATLANLLPSEYPLPEAHEWIMPTTASAPTANSDGAGMAGAWAVPRQLLLWAVRRHKLRNIENEEALATHLASDPLLSRRVRRLVLEALPLGRQMRLLHHCSGLLGVHGQAMAWVMFLPSGSRRTAAVEIFPRGLVNDIYERSSRALGVHYESLRAAPTKGCGGGRDGKLSCNVSVDVDVVRAAVLRAAEHTRGGRKVGGGIVLGGAG